VDSQEDKEEKQRLAEELTHLRGIHDILEQRRRLYETQKIRTHPNTPPNVGIELAGTEQEIRLVEAKMRRLRISPKVFDAVGVDGLFADISQRLDQVSKAIEGLAQHVEETQANDREAREARQAEVDIRLEAQDATLQEHTMELRAQSDILTAINTRGHRRQHIEWVILLVVLFVAALLIHVFG
jgi:DNA repair exonuclease SbcCD ATPase subunit